VGKVVGEVVIMRKKLFGEGGGGCSPGKVKVQHTYVMVKITRFFLLPLLRSASSRYSRKRPTKALL